jgi:uncharacterized repeat protein (TIGR02543 family)
MKKRIFSIALILCMLLSLLPANALAAEDYELYINNFRFSSSNLTYTSGSGSATYDPGTKTLTIKNLSLSTGGVNTIIESGISGLTIKIDGTLTLNLLASKVVNGVDYGKIRTNYGIAVLADTTICGANNSADKDSIIITSQCTGVDDTEYSDGTTRVGIRPMSGAKLTVKNLTVSMTDNSTGSYAGHASLFRAVAALNISGCKLVANKCQFGIYVDNYSPVTVTDTVFDMKLNGTASSGVNFAPNTVNVMQNCSGSISGEYPVYTAGQLTVSGGSKLTLTAGKMGMVAGQNQNQTPGKLILDNANVEIQSESLGIEAESGGSITMKSGTVTVTKAGYGLQVAEGSSFTMQGGTLSIRGADAASCLGINNNGTVTVTGGSLKTENVYTALQNGSSTALSVTGGEHTLTAATCGYMGDTSSELKISNTAKVTVNAATGIRLSEQSGSKLTVSGGELNINATASGVELADSTSTMTLSGGKVNITDKNSTPTITGMVCRGKSLFSGAEVTFSNCKIDLQSLNPNNKMTGGKLHLSGKSSGAQLYFGFEMTGGVIDGSTGALGIVASQGTTTLKGGTVNITASYPFYLIYDGIVDFAGANVTGTSTANCGLYVNSGSETEPDSSSYKISGGTVVLTSTQAGANAMYTSIPSNYGVWAGANEAGATLVQTPTQPILATSKYVRFAEKKAVTLTLVNVKEGTSASYLPGEAFTYTAKDAPGDQHFSHWELTVNGTTTTAGTGTTYSGRMPATDATLTAVYENCSGGAATCQKKAVCSVCGREYGILAAHKFTEEVEDEKYVITPPTCEGKGTYYKSCSVCGESAKNWVNATFTVPALGHAWSDWTSNGDGTHSRVCGNDKNHTEKEDCSGGTATCQQKAVCDFCHAEYGELAAHDFTAEVADAKYLKSDATCTEAAVYYKSCTGCGESSEGTAFEATFSHGEAKGHAWSDWTSNGDGTHRRVCGNDKNHTETEDCSGGAADCTHGPICDFCHAEYGAPGDHNYTAEVAEDAYLKDAATCTEAAVYYKSCTGCGASSKGTEHEATFSHGEAKGHDWSDWASNGDGTHSRICGNDKNHTEKEDCSGGTATCQQKAVCDTCKVEYGELAAHGYTAEVAEDAYLKDAATCTEAAIYYKSCIVCGESSKDTDHKATFSHGDPLGHDEVVDSRQEPTCTEDGLTEGKHCDRCQTVLEAQNPIPALGHNVKNGTVTKEPTCTEDGEQVGTCERCGATNITAKVEKLGHHEATVAGTAPTCAESGWSDAISCDRCGEVLQERTPLAPLGHTVVEDAETDTLTKGLHCSVCGEVLLAQFSKAGGLWTDDGNYDAALYASEPGNWVISDAADLAALAKKVNDGNTFEGFTVTLTADIDLSAHLWIPIGKTVTINTGLPFSGTFCGNLHTVSGMRVCLNGDAESMIAAGLFGMVSGAEITDLQVSGDVLLSGKFRGHYWTGGLAGYVINSTLRNCSFVGTVCSDAQNASYIFVHTGGLAGIVEEESTVENCYAIANVNTMNLRLEGTSHTGGLFGKAVSSATASNCYAAAAVTLKTVNMTHSYCGTFEGGRDNHNRVTATHCYTQLASVGANGNATVLTREQMQSEDGLVALLNAFVSENGNEENRGWFVDPAENQGYPTFGVTVRFETGIEGENATVVGVKSGSTVTPADGNILGYIFQGWFADEGRTTPFDFSKPITADTTVYGKYAPGVFTITYILNGGENAASNPTEYVYGVGATLADATRENYLFEGWYTDVALTQRITEIGTEQTGNLILFAKWSLDPNHTHAYGACRVGENGLHEQVCEICGKVEPCTYTSAVTDPTCTSSGYTTHTCDVCGSSFVDTFVEGGHIWNAVLTEPTHTEMGFTTYTCSRCKESYTSDYVAPIGHSFDDGAVTKEPTCTEEGEMLYTCSCGETYTVPIAKADHELVATVTEPTCTELGFTTHACKNCDYAYIDTYVSPTDHNWDEGKVASAPTLTETGILVQTCINCSATKETTIPMLTSCDGGNGCPSKAYVDVPDETNWAHVGIDFVLKAGLFYGTSETTFSPEATMTRAMLVTVLYRLEGKPVTEGENPFEDIADGEWYTDAVLWAAENGIVVGVKDNLFDPDGKITREQMATILYRYTKFKGLPLNDGEFVEEYPDIDRISPYAVEAMRWANAEGLINGTRSGETVTLAPQGAATRAQVAAILMRFVQNVLTK